MKNVEARSAVPQRLHGKISMVVIEGNEGTRKMLEAALRAEGYEVWSTSSCVEAVEWVKANSPEVIIADAERLGVQCSELVRTFRACSKAVLVVIVERSRERESVAALDGGADDYICKPLSVPELLARIRAKLRRN